MINMEQLGEVAKKRGLDEKLGRGVAKKRAA